MFRSMRRYIRRDMQRRLSRSGVGNLDKTDKTDKTPNPCFMFDGTTMTGLSVVSGAVAARQYNGVWNPGAANTASIQDGYFDGSEWKDTDSGGNPLTTYSMQPVDVYDAGFTAITGVEYRKKYNLADPSKIPGYVDAGARTNLIYPSGGSCLTAHALVTTTDSIDDIFGGNTARRFNFPTGVAASDPGNSAYKSFTRVNAQIGVLQVYLRGAVGVQCYVYLTTNLILSGDRILVTCTGEYQKVVITNTAAASTAYIIVSTSSYTNCGNGSPLPAATIDVSHVEFNASYSYETPPIVTTAGTVLRAASVTTAPVTGRLPVNDFAILCTAQVGANGMSKGATPGVFYSGVDGSNYLTVYMNGSNANFLKRVGGVNTYPFAPFGSAFLEGDVVQWVCGQSSVNGMVLSSRRYSGGVWSPWVVSAVIATAAGLADAAIGTTMHMGYDWTGKINQIQIKRLPAIAIPNYAGYTRKLFGLS